VEVDGHEPGFQVGRDEGDFDGGCLPRERSRDEDERCSADDEGATIHSSEYGRGEI
jgi:hypothetical protein